MFREACVVVGFRGEPIYWHLPEARTAASLPDSRRLWDVLWENRAPLQGVAHSHPGAGLPIPSWQDYTTFAGVELALGRRLVWWIASRDSLVTVLWAGPGTYDYVVLPLSGTAAEQYRWLPELRRTSNYSTLEERREHHGSR